MRSYRFTVSEWVDYVFDLLFFIGLIIMPCLSGALYLYVLFLPVAYIFFFHILYIPYVIDIRKDDTLYLKGFFFQKKLAIHNIEKIVYRSFPLSRGPNRVCLHYRCGKVRISADNDDIDSLIEYLCAQNPSIRKRQTLLP